MLYMCVPLSLVARVPLTMGFLDQRVITGLTRRILLFGLNWKDDA